MGRQRRIDLPSYWYHVIVRGNARWSVFENPIWVDEYLRLVGEAAERDDIRVGAFCAMPTHMHMVLQRRRIPLAKTMHRIQSTFAKRFNKPRKRTGHVFQGRYHAFVVLSNKYLAALVRYVHLNPVRAGLCESPGGHLYTSHHFYSSRNGQFPFVHPLPGFGGRYGLTRYRALMGTRDDSTFPITGEYIGMESEVLEVDSAMDRRRSREVLRTEAEKWCRRRRYDLEKLRSRRRTRDVSGPRGKLVAKLYEDGFSPSVIARFFSMQPASVLGCAARRRKLIN